MTKIYPVIMCGGAGSRLWPMSTLDKPKQFHSIVTENSMLQETIIRVKERRQVGCGSAEFCLRTFP